MIKFAYSVIGDVHESRLEGINKFLFIILPPGWSVVHILQSVIDGTVDISQGVCRCHALITSLGEIFGGKRSRFCIYAELVNEILPGYTIISLEVCIHE